RSTMAPATLWVWLRVRRVRGLWTARSGWAGWTRVWGCMSRRTPTMRPCPRGVALLLAVAAVVWRAATWLSSTIVPHLARSLFIPAMATTWTGLRTVRVVGGLGVGVALVSLAIRLPRRRPSGSSARAWAGPRPS